VDISGSFALGFAALTANLQIVHVIFARFPSNLKTIAKWLVISTNLRNRYAASGGELNPKRFTLMHFEIGQV